MNKRDLVSGNIPPLSQERRRALILWYLWKSVGQVKVTSGKMARAAASASGQSVTTYQAENELHHLVDFNFAEEETSVSSSSRVSRSYAITTSGLILLTAHLEHLPKLIRDEAEKEFYDVTYQANVLMYRKKQETGVEPDEL